MSSLAKFSITCLLGLFLGEGLALAWGPHPTITQATLDVLGENDPLILHLGAQAQHLTNYAWMADFRRLPFEEPDEFFYADDYLLFPEVTTHLDHICPEVKQTYRPYFKRAVQALRTESPANAARWIGSLLHFTEDTGSPPHAAEIRGIIHTKMETWVDADQIQIRGYRPQLFGENEAMALAGFLRRMDALIEFSKGRGQRLRVPVSIGNSTAVKPIVLECALETSRVVADLLHTLGHVALKPINGSGAIRGRIHSVPPPGRLGQFAARVVIEGTSFSTLADLSGRFEFHNLYAGEHKLTALRAGNSTALGSIIVSADQTNVCELHLTASNLIRNGDFTLRWVRSGAPDYWYSTKTAWEGEIIPLKIGQRYRVSADFKAGAKEDVLVRWTQYLPHAVPRNGPIPRIETQTLTPGEKQITFTGAPDMGLIQVILRGTRQPSDICAGITLVPVAAE